MREVILDLHFQSYGGKNVQSGGNGFADAGFVCAFINLVLSQQ